jgi:hypothetical protein
MDEANSIVLHGCSAQAYITGGISPTVLDGEEVLRSSALRDSK